MQAFQMEPTWSASLTLSNEEVPIEIHQMHFFAQDTRCQTMPPETRLSFLSFVQCARIPLHIVTGPAYEVIASRSPLLESIANTVSNDKNDVPRPLSRRDTTESDIGALLRVEFDNVKGTQVSTEITELLLYASVEVESKASTTMPTTAGLELSEKDPLRRVRFFALPLSSHLLFKPNLWELPLVLSDDEQSSIINATVLNQPDLDRSKKRQRLNSLFQDATKTKRKPSRQDSQDLAHLLPSRPQSPLVIPDDGRRLSDVKYKPLHSRTQSLGSLSEARPDSRDHPLERARSSLSRVDSITDMTARQTPEATITLESSVVEEKNRKMLSTLVLAGMRMRGMSQKKRREEEPTLEPDELEYKLMYHNTFKAASFALRNRSRHELSSEAIREVVDVLLDLFCTSGAASAGFDVTSLKLLC